MKKILSIYFRSYWMPTALIWLTIAIVAIMLMWLTFQPSEAVFSLYIISLFVLLPSTLLIVLITSISQLVKRKWALAIINLLAVVMSAGVVMSTILLSLSQSFVKF